MPTRAEVANRMRGMTLIELMGVLAVVAILSTIAVGSYRQYVLRGSRRGGTGGLLRLEAAHENFSLQNKPYTTNWTARPPTGLGASSPTPNGFYTIAVTGDPNPTNNIATSFLATATAVAPQTK